MKNKLMGSCFITLSLLSGLAAKTAIAGSISDNSLIQVRQFSNSRTFGNAITNNITTSPTVLDVFSSSIDGDIRAHGSLGSGQTGTRVANNSSDEFAFGHSRIHLFDTLNFTTPNNQLTDISYAVNFEGALSNSSTFAGTEAQTTISIYDITGLDTWLEDNGQVGDNRFIFTQATLVSEVAIRLFVGTQELLDQHLFAFPAPGHFDEAIVNNSGAFFDFDLDKSGTFTANSNRSYGIEIDTFSNAHSGASSDFFNTSSFEFSNLNGATFNSGSGVFLTTIPVPSAVWLFGSGLIGLFGMKRKSSILPA